MTYILKRIGNDYELPLYDALLKVGSSLDDDDILVEEQGVTPTQFQFIFVDNQVVLQGGRVWVDGVLVTQFPKVVLPLQVMSLNDDVHLVYGAEGFEVPVAPKLQHPKTETVVKKSVDYQELLQKVRPYWKWVATGLGAMAVIWMALAVSNHYFPKQNQLVLPVYHEEMSDEYIETYVRQVVGANLLSYEEDDDVIVVRVLEGTVTQEQRWVEDLGRLAKRLEGEKTLILEIVHIEDLVRRVKEQLQTMGGFENIKVNVNGRTVTLVGVALPRSYSHVRESVEKVTKDNPDVRIVNEIQELKGADFDIVSLSISRNNASAVLRRQGEVRVVPEGGDVFGAGVLKLIRHNGLVLATKWGDVFVPWKL